MLKIFRIAVAKCHHLWARLSCGCSLGVAQSGDDGIKIYRGEGGGRSLEAGKRSVVDMIFAHLKKLYFLSLVRMFIPFLGLVVYSRLRRHRWNPPGPCA